MLERLHRRRADISPHDSAKRFNELGAGKFTGPDTIEVGGRTLRFAKAVIATGARAAAPPIPGWKDVPDLTNETRFSLTELLKRFGILGAGPIGGELAQRFAGFGAEVFLAEAEHGILPREDRDAAEIVRTTREHDGVKLLGCGENLKLAKDANGVRLQVESHGKGYDGRVNQLLVAAITDNAALTYLGSLVEGLSDELKYARVAGAVTGGGLTLIANAPNPAGVGILQAAKAFEDEGISPLGLFLGALLPTAVAVVFFWLLH